MPTKRRRVHRVQRPALSPAAIFLLMVGRFAPPGLFGWANLFWDQAPFDHDVVKWRDAVMTPAIAAWLETDAHAHAFSPWAITGRRPRGAGVPEWERAFLSEHGRRG
jgi:hypothetical protein